MRHIPNHIIKYNEDLSFVEFAELVWCDINDLFAIFSKTSIIPESLEKIDFDTACILIDDIDKLHYWWPIMISTILKRWNLRSSKTLKQISVGEKIAIDIYPFNHYNRKLECISKMCHGDHGDWDYIDGNPFKMFQMKNPDKIFIIEDSDWENFKYHWWYYHLNDPLENLRLLDNKKLNEDYLNNLGEEIEKCNKYNELINDIIIHKDEYVTPNWKKSNINYVAKALKNGNSYINQSKEVCDKCWNSLSSIYYESSWINYSYYHILICPNCKIDYWIDPEYWLCGVVH